MPTNISREAVARSQIGALEHTAKGSVIEENDPPDDYLGKETYFLGLLNQFANMKNRARNHKINRIW
jgi:hypothetical protein